MNKIIAKELSPANNKIFFYSILILLAIIVYKMMESYVILILMAFITAVLCAPIYNWFYNKLGKRYSLSTALSLLFVLIIIIVPTTLIIDVAVKQAQTFIVSLQEYVQSNPVSIEKIAEAINNFFKQFPFLSISVDANILKDTIKNNLAPAASLGVNVLIEVSKSLLLSIPSIIFYLFLLAGFFPNKDRILNTLKKVSPLSNEIDNLYIQRFESITQSIVKGSVIVAAAQVVPTFILFTILGVPYPVFWCLLAFLIALTPFGSGVINIPVAIALILSGNTAGWLILAVQLLIIGNIDGMLRPRLVNKDANIHPILVLLSIFGGLAQFSVWGIIIGPIIMVLFITTIDVYQKYYKNN